MSHFCWHRPDDGTATRVYDHRMIRNLEQQEVPLGPDHKLVEFYIGTAISLVLIGHACNDFDPNLAGYLADSYLTYTASGFAALFCTDALVLRVL